MEGRSDHRENLIVVDGSSGSERSLIVGEGGFGNRDGAVALDGSAMFARGAMQDRDFRKRETTGGLRFASLTLRIN